jgi:hypothetical protein
VTVPVCGLETIVVRGVPDVSNKPRHVDTFSDLGNGVQIGDWSVGGDSICIRPFFCSGITSACLYLAGNFPSPKGSVMSLAISGANNSAHVLMTDVSILSRGEDFAGIERISL